MMQSIQKDAAARMEKSVKSLEHELSKIRTGRANVRFYLYYTSREKRNGGDHQYIQRIPIIGQSFWNKTIVSRVHHGGMEHSIEAHFS